MNISLIGMPGAGKSTIGKRLAEHLGAVFVDPDKLIETEYGKPLSDILADIGEEAFLEMEGEVTRRATRGRPNCVIATGGSIVYNESAMDYLSDIGFIVYLKVPLGTLTERIEKEPRAIIGSGEKTLEELYAERDPLYTKWANAIVYANIEEGYVLEDVLAVLP